MHTIIIIIIVLLSSRRISFCTYAFILILEHLTGLQNDFVRDASRVMNICIIVLGTYVRM